MPNELALPNLKKIKIEAAVRRILADGGEGLKDGEIQSLAESYMNSSLHDTGVYGVSTALTSFTQNKVVRDYQYEIDALTTYTTEISKAVKGLSSDLFSMITNAYYKAKEIEDGVVEEEYRAEEAIAFVKHCSFVKGEDSNNGNDNTFWNIDPKTQNPFPSSNSLVVTPGAGLTLPERNRAQIVPQTFFLDRQNTDFGDSGVPLVETDINSLKNPSSIFRFIVLQDVLSGYIPARPRASTLCIGSDFGGFRLINQMSILLAGQSQLVLKKIEAEVSTTSGYSNVSFVEVRTAGTIHCYIEPIRARSIKIYLEASAPIDQGNIVQRDETVAYINDQLRGMGFTHFLDSVEIRRNTRAYDLSIKEVKFFHVEYQTGGIYKGSPRRFKNLKSVKVERTVKEIDLSSSIYENSSNFVEYPETDVYLGVKTFFEGRLVRTGLYPMPDSGLHKEALIARDGVADFSFIPYLANPLVPSLEVYENEVLLTYGVDYELGANGANWSSSLTTRDYIFAALQGHMKASIRFLNFKSDAFYRATYKPIMSYLNIDKSVVCNYEKLLFATAPSLEHEVTPVFIMRKASSSSLITPILETYTMKVQGNR